MPQFFDDFTRANNSSLGSNWTNVIGSVGIDANQAIPTTAFSDCDAHYTGTGAPTTGSHFVKGTAANAPTNSVTSTIDLNIRGGTGVNFFNAAFSFPSGNPSCKIYEVTTGTWTQRGSTTATANPQGNVLRFVSTSGAVSVYNDTTVAQVMSYTSTAKNTNTRVGIGGWWNIDSTTSTRQYRWDDVRGGDGVNGGSNWTYVAPVAYGSATITGEVPPGTGGALVTLVFHSNAVPTPVTPGDWTFIDSRTDWSKSQVIRYITDVANPDMSWTYTDNEVGIAVYRIENAASPLVYGSSWDDFVRLFDSGTSDMPDVTVASNDGVALLHMILDGTNPPPDSLSLPWTIDQTGKIVPPTGFWAAGMAMYHLPAESIAGNFDAGTATWTTSSAASAGVLFIVTEDPGWDYIEHWIGASGNTWPAQWVDGGATNTGSATINTDGMQGRMTAGTSVWSDTWEYLDASITDFDATFLVDTTIDDYNDMSWHFMWRNQGDGLTSARLATGYTLLVNPGTQTIYLFGTQSFYPQDDTPIASVNTAVDHGSTKRWYRVQHIGNDIKIKSWLVGTIEPSNWTIEVTDSSHTAAGRLAFGLNNHNVAANRTVLFDSLFVNNIAAPAAGITDYLINYRTTAGPGAWQNFDDGVDATVGATVTGLPPNTSHDFRIAAINENGAGPWSNIVTVISGADGTVKLAIGDVLASALYVGDTLVTKAYLGDTQVL